MRPTAWKSTAVAAKQLLSLVKNKRSKVKDIPRGSFPFDMVLPGDKPGPMKIYSPLIQSTSKQSRGLQGFKQIRGAERSHEATRTTSSNWPIYEADFEGGRTQAVFEQWPTYEPTPVVLNKARERSRVLDKAPCVWSADGGRFGWIQLIH